MAYALHNCIPAGRVLVGLTHTRTLMLLWWCAFTVHVRVICAVQGSPQAVLVAAWGCC
jgi:hypothetical protein